MSTFRTLSSTDKKLIRQCIRHIHIQSKSKGYGVTLLSHHGACSMMKTPQNKKGVLQHTGTHFECDTKKRRSFSSKLYHPTDIQFGSQHTQLNTTSTTLNLTMHQKATLDINRCSKAGFHTSSKKCSAGVTEDIAYSNHTHDEGTSSVTETNHNAFTGIHTHTKQGTGCPYSSNRSMPFSSFKDTYSSDSDHFNTSACPFSALLDKTETKKCKEAESGSGNHDHEDEGSTRPMSEIPGPRSLPYIGTMYKYIPHLGEFSNKDSIVRDSQKLEKYGEIVREEIAPGTTLIHLFHPDDMEKVYRHNGMFPSRGLVNALIKYRRDKGLPDDMINAQGQEWRRLRKPAQKHLYNQKVVAAYVPVQDPICDDLVKVIRDKRDGDASVHDTSKELNKWALECIGTLMYDTRMGVMQAQLPENSLAEETFRNLMVAFEAIYKCIFFWPLHKSGKTKMWKEFVRTMDFIRNTSERLTGVCKEKQRQGEEGLVPQSLNLPLSIISDSTISHGEVLDIQTALLMGGIDTASYSTLFALYHLATNPEKQEKLHAELTRLNPDNTPATPELLAKAKYLKAVLKENFRMNPVFPFVARLLTDDITIRGYKIPAGTRILNHHGVASRRAEFVDNPESFTPERWVRDGSKKGKVRHAFACMPYGFGSRMCIGRRYAEQELMLVISKLVQNFKVEYDGPPLKFHSKLLYCPSQKMSFRFVDRK